MKKLLIFACFFVITSLQAQETKPTFEQVGDKVKATYFYADGAVYRQGFFKNQKLAGQWTEFDQKGNKTLIAFYQNGKKIGTWYQWKNDLVREMIYENNKIVSVGKWKEDDSSKVYLGKVLSG